MSKEIQKHQGQVVDLTRFTSPDQLWAALNAQPEHVERNKFAQNSEYIPISYVEQQLDEMFGALNWQLSGCVLSKEGSYVNGKGTEMLLFTCTLELQVLHPIRAVWVTRTGASSGSASANQFETFAPKLKAEAFKNAAKSLGPVFGRELNRMAADVPEVLGDIKRDEYKDFAAKINAVETVEELGELYRSHAMRKTPAFRKLFLDRKKALENA